MQGRYPIWFAWPMHAMHAPVWLQLPLLLPVLFAQSLLGHFGLDGSAWCDTRLMAAASCKGFRSPALCCT